MCAREREISTPNDQGDDPTLQIRDFLLNLVDHVRQRGSVTFGLGAADKVEYRIAIAVPPWWYGKVQAPAIKLPTSGLQWCGEALFVAEPIACLSYFLSKNKKHSLQNGGALCHCNMDEDFTIITEVTPVENASVLNARLESTEIQTLGLKEISNAFREVVEKRLDNDLGALEEDPKAVLLKLNEIQENFLQFLPRYEGFKDYKFRLPWSVADQPERGIRNGQMVMEAATIRELVFKKLLLPLSESLASRARARNEKLHVLCSGALSECPYVAQCLDQLLSDQGVGESVEILKVVNGRTSACRGASIFLDSNRRQIQIHEIEMADDFGEVFVNPTTKARSTLLEERGTELKATVDQIITNKITGLAFDESQVTRQAKKARVVLQEQLERFGFTSRACGLFVLLHSLYQLLERYDDCKDIRAQFDKAFADKYNSGSATHVEDPLFWFCKSGAPQELMQFLLDTGSSVDKPAPFESSTLVYPLHVAIKYDKLPLLEWLLDKGANISAKTSDGSTCLHLAIRNLATANTLEAKQIVQALVSKFAQQDGLLNIEDANGYTALDIAKDTSMNEIAKALMSVGAQENSSIRALRAEAMKAISANDVSTFRKLLDSPHKTQFSLGLPHGRNLLHWAVLKKSFNIVQELLTTSKTSLDIDVNSRCVGGWSSLHLAVEKGDLAIVPLLLQSGADVEASSDTMYGWVKVNKEIPFGSPGALSFTGSECPREMCVGGWKPLHLAALAGNEPISRILLENGAKTDSTDLEGCTAIQRAIANGHEHLVRVILDYENASTTADDTPLSTSIHSETSANVFGDGAIAITQHKASPSIQQTTAKGRNALHDAVEAKNAAILELLLQNHMNPNSQCPSSGWTPLSYAVAEEQEPLVQRLLQHGANPCLLHSDGSSLLHLAVSGKNIKLVDNLLPHLSVTATDIRGATPLHYTARDGFSPIARMLVNRGADVNARDFCNQTPLYYAIENSNSPVAQLLLSRGAQTDIVDSSQRTLLHAAASGANPSALQLLASSGGVLKLPLEATDSERNTPLQLAAMTGHVATVQAFLHVHRAASLGRPVLNALFAVSASGIDSIVKTILDHDRKLISAYSGDSGTVNTANVGGIDVISKLSWTPLHIAAWHARPSTVLLFLVQNISADITSQHSFTPLGLVSIIPKDKLQSEHLEVAAILLDHGAHLSTGGLGNPLLNLAAIAGHEDLIDLFLSRGADISSKNSKGRSALCCAVQNGQSSVVTMLLDNGADAKETNEGLPLLHDAALVGSLDTLKLLVAKGANVNGLAEDGTTALLAAASSGHIEVMNYLLEAGCQLAWRTEAGKLSALDVAVTHSQLEAVKAILDSPFYKSTFGTDYSYAWTAADKGAANNQSICRYIYERTDCLGDNGARILHWAVAEDRQQLLKFLIDYGLDMKTPNSDGWSAFHAAVMKGKLSIARDILDTGFDVNYADYQSRTALHQAVASNRPESVKFLLSHHAKKHVRDEDSQLPVHIAIDYGSFGALEALQLSPEDFNSKDFGGQSLVSFAAESGDDELLRILLKKERKLKKPQNSSLHQAISSRDIQLVRNLVGHGADLNIKDADGRSPLREAVQTQDQQVASILLESGADVESKCKLGITPLAYAAKLNDVEMAELLIKHGANINAVEIKNACPVLVDAAWRGFLGMLDLLIRSGADLQIRTSKGDCALQEAALQGHTDVIKRLVQAGLPVDIRGQDGHTALSQAARFGQLISVRALIELGANANTKSDVGYFPLHHVAENDQVEIIDLLLNHGAEIDCVDSTGRTPILIAARKGSEAAFRMLLERGAELNLVNDSGCNALHFAAHGGSVNIGRLLLSRFFATDGRDDKGHTPLLSAASNGSVEFVRFLSVEGADLSAKSNAGETAVCIATLGKEAKHVEVARLLIQLGQDFELPKDTGHTPLMLASEVGNLDTVTMLVEQGASLSTKTDTGWDILHAAAHSGNVHVLKYLLLHGMQLSDDRSGTHRNTILHGPATNGHVAMVEAIAEKLPSLMDIKNDAGLNPLQQSVRNQRLGVLKKLRDLGADINVMFARTGGSLMHLVGELDKPDDASEIVKYLLHEGIAIEAENLEGFTPLKIAASLGRTHAAAALLDNGANIESAAGKGGRAIDLAVLRGHAAMVKLLMSRGASVTHLNSNGNTLLYGAVDLNQVAVVRVLLDHGAAVDTLSSGWTALHLACSKNKPEIIEILLQHGAGPFQSLERQANSNRCEFQPDRPGSPHSTTRCCDERQLRSRYCSVQGLSSC